MKGVFIMKELLKEFKQKIENIDITYDYEETYNNLYNAYIDYENETNDYNFEYLFEDIINYDMAEERARDELDQGGLIRLYYFLGDANLNRDLFRVDGYGNLTDIEIEDLKNLKQEILDKIEELESEV